MELHFEKNTNKATFVLDCWSCIKLTVSDNMVDTEVLSRQTFKLQELDCMTGNCRNYLVWPRKLIHSTFFSSLVFLASKG